jgi:hypothetical protein
MRNVLIVVAAIAGLVVIGLGVKYGWQAASSGSDAAYDQLQATGKLTGAPRDEFIAQSVAGCEKKRPDTISADLFKQFCVCASQKAADLITPAEAKVVNDTSVMPDSLVNKLQEPIKQCLKAGGLQPAQ